jgi:hypothetical protein
VKTTLKAVDDSVSLPDIGSGYTITNLPAKLIGYDVVREEDRYGTGWMVTKPVYEVDYEEIVVGAVEKDYGNNIYGLYGGQLKWADGTPEIFSKEIEALRYSNPRYVLDLNNGTIFHAWVNENWFPLCNDMDDRGARIAIGLDQVFRTYLHSWVDEFYNWKESDYIEPNVIEFARTLKGKPVKDKNGEIQFIFGDSESIKAWSSYTGIKPYRSRSYDYEIYVIETIGGELILSQRKNLSSWADQ